jgi:hypothetical protein
MKIQQVNNIINMKGGLFSNSKYTKTRMSNPQYMLVLKNDGSLVISLQQLV